MKMTDADLTNIQQMTSLETLNLESAEVSNDGIQALGTLRRLRELDLTWTNVSDLSVISHLTNLEKLSLHCCPIRDEQLQHLAHLTRLRELQLGFSEVTDAGLK